MDCSGDFAAARFCERGRFVPEEEKGRLLRRLRGLRGLFHELRAKGAAGWSGCRRAGKEEINEVRAAFFWRCPYLCVPADKASLIRRGTLSCLQYRPVGQIEVEGQKIQTA